MRILFILAFIVSACLPISSPFAEDDPPAQPGQATRQPALQADDRLSQAYLAQALAFKRDGRYELARQSCAQALTTCKNPVNLETIKRELDEIELLIRSLR